MSIEIMMQRRLVEELDVVIRRTPIYLHLKAASLLGVISFDMNGSMVHPRKNKNGEEVWFPLNKSLIITLYLKVINNQIILNSFLFENESLRDSSRPYCINDLLEHYDINFIQIYNSIDQFIKELNEKKNFVYEDILKDWRDLNEKKVS